MPDKHAQSDTEKKVCAVGDHAGTVAYRYGILWNVECGMWNVDNRGKKSAEEWRSTRLDDLRLERSSSLPT
jgi:hypothetical protein